MGGVWKVGKEDGVGNFNRVRGCEAFGNSDGELAEGDGDRRLGSVRDKGFYEERGREGARNGGGGCGERRQLGKKKGLGTMGKRFIRR